MPDVPEDWMGWLCPDTAKALSDRLSLRTKWVVECGTWLGMSARAILESAPNTNLACIDTWKGSPEHHADKKSDGTPGEWAKRLPTLYQTCQRNLWPWRDRVVMVKEDSLVGLGEVFSLGLQPDLIYLDSKHTLGRVTAELAVCRELFPGTPIVGDDYRMIAHAVQEHARLFNRALIDCGDAFAFDPVEVE